MNDAQDLCEFGFAKMVEEYLEFAMDVDKMPAPRFNRGDMVYFIIPTSGSYKGPFHGEVCIVDRGGSFEWSRLCHSYDILVTGMLFKHVPEFETYSAWPNKITVSKLEYSRAVRLARGFLIK